MRDYIVQQRRNLIENAFVFTHPNNVTILLNLIKVLRNPLDNMDYYYPIEDYYCLAQKEIQFLSLG